MTDAVQPSLRQYSEAIMRLNFVEDRDVDSVAALTAVLDELGVPAEETLREARSEKIKLRLRERVEQARARGIFGARTFFVGHEMFWGDDRLEDAVAFALQ